MEIAARTTFNERRQWIITPTERALWDLDDGTGEDRIFRHQVLAFLPPFFEQSVGEWYSRQAKRAGTIEANRWLYRIVEQVEGSTFRLGASDHELIEYAERRARDCRRMAAKIPDKLTAYNRAVSFAQAEGVAPPKVERGITVEGALARLGCERWWRRAVRHTHGRRLEGAAIRIGMVHQRADIYASEPTVNRRREQKTRNRRALESMQAVNELGDEFTLAELAELSVSNPAIRRGELMTRIAGFEQIANEAGHVGLFYTVTCPSRMHARLIDGGEENPKYDGTTPREAQKYLCGLWARARASFDRKKIYVYGFRIAEPHHDATPHWHLLLFVEASKADEATAILRTHALAVDGDEKGASEHRFKAVEIDKKRGSAAGYVAKYVAKNIDGFGIDFDLFGKDPKKGAQRVDSWAATWGIRQFQQIGGPTVTVWRELRRLRDEEQSGDIERARFAANLGDWAGYIIAQGGALLPRASRPVALVKREKATRYGETAERVIGVASRADGLFVLTRVHEWKIRRAGIGKIGAAARSGVGNVYAVGKIGAAARSGVVVSDGETKEQSSRESNSDNTRAAVFLARDFCAPWSSVNNCTGDPTGPPD